MKIKFLKNYANIISKQGFLSNFHGFRDVNGSGNQIGRGVCTELKNDFQIHKKIASLWIAIAIQVCFVLLCVTIDKLYFKQHICMLWIIKKQRTW